jgi:4-hydroxy-tetrahydrodipicolinate reductase
MSGMKIVVTGAAGRMGQALIRAIAAQRDMTLHAAVLHAAIERKGASQIGMDAGVLAGIGPLGVAVTDDPLPAFASADAVLDFTIPAATVEFAGYAAQARIVHVIGTTGCTPEDEAKIAAAARHATIVKSGNYSLGVNILAALTEKVAKLLSPQDYDIEVLEMHHKRKVDAPSGTALLLGEAAATGRGVALSGNCVRSRDGHTGARVDGTIGFATLRGGSVVGDHSVIFAGEDEQITLTHHAVNRSMFAGGALAAARWACGRKPGLYSMRDVLDLNS